MFLYGLQGTDVASVVADLLQSNILYPKPESKAIRMNNIVTDKSVFKIAKQGGNPRQSRECLNGVSRYV
jgi:hypothetical protein